MIEVPECLLDGILDGFEMMGNLGGVDGAICILDVDLIVVTLLDDTRLTQILLEEADLKTHCV